jgi:hypothetical protein
MSKVTVTIDRSMTINTANFSSIRPSVSVSANDIEPDKVGEIFAKLADLADALMAKETMSLYGEMSSVGELTISKYYEELKKSEENIDGAIKSFNITG